MIKLKLRGYIKSELFSYSKYTTSLSTWATRFNVLNERRSEQVKKFLFIYASVFSVIWIGYGIYAMLTNQPSAGLVLSFGLAFSVVVFAASWFSTWLMGHYKKIDSMAKNIIGEKRNERKA